MTGDEPDVRDGKDLRRLALALKVHFRKTVITSLVAHLQGRSSYNCRLFLWFDESFVLQDCRT